LTIGKVTKFAKRLSGPAELTMTPRSTKKVMYLQQLSRPLSKGIYSVNNSADLIFTFKVAKGMKVKFWQKVRHLYKVLRKTRQMA